MTNQKSFEKSLLSKQRKIKSSKMQKKANFWGWIFILLPIIGTIAFVFIPIVLSVYLSFTNWTGQTPLFAPMVKFQQFDNYIKVFKDERVWQSFGNTLFYMLGIPLGLLISLGLAICMNRNILFKNSFRVIYYIPVVASIVSISLLFKNLFNPNGVINSFLKLFGVTEPVFWLTAPLNKISIVLTMTWKNLGGTILLLIAGLQGVNRSYYEAAKLDGAGTLKIFFKITMPQLVPVVFYVIVTSIIGGAQIFTEPQLFFGSKDFTTMPLVLYLYNEGMGNYSAGYASAISILLGLFIFVITAAQFAINKRSEA